MMKIGFDNDKYLKMQSEHIRERIGKFGGKLYLEFGGKLFDDYHASRVLPGFQPDSKLQMLLQLKDQAVIVVVISAEDIISSKVRGDYGITYDLDVLRLIDAFQEMGLYVGSVCVTKYAAAPEVEAFEKRLNSLGIRTFRHYKIPGYPNDVARIVSDEGYGRNEYIETERPLVVITAPGPGSGKMATCLSQLYHEHKRGVKAGYAKFETFPIWNIPLKHPVNLAYEAATADLNDVNMIDPFHLEVSALGLAGQPAKEMTLAELIEHRATHLAAYQDARLAERYRLAVGRIEGLGDTALTRSVATQYARLLAPKDEYEVARLYTEGDFMRRLGEQFAGEIRLNFLFAPPLLAKPGPDGRPRKLRFGPWLLPVLRLLAKARRLRGSWADPFRQTADRALDRRLLADYEADLALIASRPGPLDEARALADWPAAVRGFGPVREHAAEQASARRQRARSALMT